MATKYDYYTYQQNKYDRNAVNVYGWGTYPKGSVLAGQPLKQYLGQYDSVEALLADYPGAEPSNQYTEPQVSLSHLPGEDDPVPGGAYPDDIDDGY